MLKSRMPYSEHTDEIIEDICYTLKSNKEVIKDLSKDFTREIAISFSIKPDEVLTMDIYCNKLVKSEEMKVEKQIKLKKK